MALGLIRPLPSRCHAVHCIWAILGIVQVITACADVYVLVMLYMHAPPPATAAATAAVAEPFNYQAMLGSSTCEGLQMNGLMHITGACQWDAPVNAAT